MEKKDYEERFNIFYKELSAQFDLPMPLAIMANNFLSKIPDLLADEDKQQELLNLIQLIGWVIGYKVYYMAEDEASAIEEEEV